MRITTRQRILDEATRQLVEQGYTAFTVASVRDVLNLSSGSMFHAFASKPALAAEVFVTGMRAYQDVAITAITGPPDPGDAIEAWIEAHLGWVEDHPDLARYLFSTQPDEVIEAAAEALGEANAAFSKAIDDLFTMAGDAGLCAALPRTVLHSIVMGPAQEHCRQWTRGTTDLRPRQTATTYKAVARAALATTLHPHQEGKRP